MQSFVVKTRARTDFVDITNEVAMAGEKSERKDGTVAVFIPHTTAGITINENADPNVVADIIAGLDRLVPWEAAYRHSEGNSAAHIKASLMGSSITVMMEKGRLKLGTWQGIYLCEFDGPRSRQVWVG